MQTNENSLVGTTLRDRYYIDRLLSADVQGGQGKVYFATDTTTHIDKQYVVKQFTPNYSDSYLLKVGTRLFQQEAEILQKLGSHSQIPQILDYFADKQHFFLVQEWIEGQNLQQEINSQQKLSEAEAIALLKDTLEVLSFVHRSGYIHRDIKPANLIRNKYDRKIYLIDFGAVKEKIRPENIDKQGNSTRTVIVGTEGYMPTEQLRGTPEFCSDIYALGMVAIQAITGILPEQLLLDERYSPIWREHLDPEIEDNPNFLNLIDRMVRGHYKERYQSTAEVLDDLDRLHLVSFPEFLPANNGETVPQTKIIKKKSLIPWLIAGFGTVIVAVAGISLLGNTEKYVSYDNTEQDIELDYPEKWSVQDDWMSLQPGVNFLSPLENNRDEFQETVTVSIEELTQPLSLNEYTAQATAQIEGFNTIIEPAKDTTFANREGREIIYQEKDGNKKQMEVWMIKNQKAYIATYSAEEETFNKFAKQAKKIIASLEVN